MIIDFNAHLTRDYETKKYLIEEQIADMKENKIDLRVISTYVYSTNKEANDITHKLATEYPTLFIPCATINPKLDNCAEETKRVTEELKFKVIEINPRVPASIRAADISGINYPRIMVCDVLGMPKEQMDYRTGMCLRYLGLDLMWFFKSKNRFKVKPCWFKFWGDRLFYQDLYRSNIKFSLCVLYSNVLKLFR